MESPILTPATTANFKQTISFNASEQIYNVNLMAQDVKIICSSGKHNHGSSKVKLTNVVDYNWEHKYYMGQLLAVHLSGKFFAYGIKGKGGGMVRVAHTENQLRALIKEMNGQIQDLAFAHIFNQVILGCVDEEGSLFVHKVEQQDAIICTLMLHIVQNSPRVNSHSINRVVWCPFLPEDDETEEDNSTLLVLTHGNKAELLSVNLITNKHGIGPICLSDITDGYLEINEHSEPITDAAFSPDGTAVATASADGYVKFFQIYMHEGKSPRCLHEWQPHNGKPLSFLDFLDNHQLFSSDEQFWKFAITGCNNNSELKIWSCETWSCLQTISFAPNPMCDINELFFKVRLDLTAGYLLLSEINTKILYVLEMHRDSIGAKAYAKSVSEFLLPAAFLSFGILEAANHNFRCANSSEDLYPTNDTDDYEEGENIVATVIKMYVVQPKKLQVCYITYQTESCTNQNNDNLSNKLLYDESLVDTSEKINQEDLDKLSQLTAMLQKEIPNQHFSDLQNLLIQPSEPLNLMTPDAFSSPVKNDHDTTLLKESSSPNLINLNSDSEQINNDTVPSATSIETDMLFQRPTKDTLASGGSSPSREVQEILNNSTYSAHEFYENDEKTELVKKNNSYTQGEAYQNNFTDTAGMMKEWPSAPIVNVKDVLKKDESRLRTSPFVIPVQDIIFSAGDNGIATVNHKNETESEIKALREEFAELKNIILMQQQSMDKKCTCVQVDDIENIFKSNMDSHFSMIKNMVHELSDLKQKQERQYHEELKTKITRDLSNTVKETLAGNVSMQMQENVVPKIVKGFENMYNKLHEEFRSKLMICDEMVMESLNRLLTSKSVAESLGNNLAPLVRPSMEQSFKNVAISSLVPQWEKLCSNMFIQLNETFSQGTKEYTTSVEQSMDKQHKQQNKIFDLIQQMQGIVDILMKVVDEESTFITLQKDIQSESLKNEERMKKFIKETVTEQMNICFKHQKVQIEDSVANAVRSRAVTPSPQVLEKQNIFTMIQQLLARGDINTAFQQALSASDLPLVIYICEKLNPQDVFYENPCPLQQHVLLSLIQQLSADDFHNHTELKFMYLEEAVVKLDVNNPVTKEHMSTVLRELNRKLLAFIAGNPKNKLIKNIRMLQMATQTLMNI